LEGRVRRGAEHATHGEINMELIRTLIGPFNGFKSFVSSVTGIPAARFNGKEEIGGRLLKTGLAESREEASEITDWLLVENEFADSESPGGYYFSWIKHQTKSGEVYELHGYCIWSLANYSPAHPWRKLQNNHNTID